MLCKKKKNRIFVMIYLFIQEVNEKMIDIVAKKKKIIEFRSLVNVNIMVVCTYLFTNGQVV